MRNNLLLLSAFTAATLSLGIADSAEAAPKKSTKHPTAKVTKAKHAKVSGYDAIGAYAVNTAGCPAPALPTAKAEDWKNAKLTAQFIKQEDGSYQANILPGAANEDEHVPIASIAKFMTALVIFDLVDQKKMNLGQVIPVTKESLCLGDNRFAVIGLPAGIHNIVGDHAMTQMVKISSNTMAVNLAIAAAGSVKEFVKLMNGKAAEYGMTNTKFVTPHGLPEGDRKGEYTTARDMMIMAEHILPYMEQFRKYGNAPLETWTLPDQQKAHIEKAKLTGFGAIFKTGTVAKCSSLLTVVEQGEYKMVDVQLCNKNNSRFSNALATVSAVFKRVGEMVVSPAMASSTHPKTEMTTTAAVSSRLIPPLDP